MRFRIFLFFCIGFALYGKAQDPVVNIPDAVFKAQLLSASSSNYIAMNVNGNWVPVDTNGDGQIQVSEALNIKTLKIEDTSMASMEGIGSFTNLTSLNCCNNKITALDLTNNTKLENVDCQTNQLTTLDVSMCPKLDYLYCSANMLNLLKMNNIINLECNNNQLTTLDMSTCSKLSHLSCYGNNLSYLNVQSNTNLQVLYCFGNKLTTLDLSMCMKLIYLYCDNNKLNSLNIQNNTGLQFLNCDNNQITSLDVSLCPNLQHLCCMSNNITSLNISKNTNLETLLCAYNQLITLDVSICSKLINLICSSNHISTLDVSMCANLQQLYCDQNNLISLNVTNTTNLYLLNCVLNQLTRLDVSKCTNLKYLFCYNNKIESLNVKNAINLYLLECSDNQLVTFDVSSCLNLDVFQCYNNNLVKLNIRTGKTISNLTFLTNPNLYCILCNDWDVSAVTAMANKGAAINTDCFYEGNDDDGSGNGNDSNSNWSSNAPAKKRYVRTIVQTYDTRNYYVKGNLLTTAVYDSTHRVQQETRHTYYAYLVKARRAKVSKRRYDNNRFYETDATQLPDNLVAATPLQYTENRQYTYDDDNNQSASTVTSQEQYTYHVDYNTKDNCFADLKTYRYSDKKSLLEDGSGNYNYEAVEDYATDNMTKKYYVTGMPAEHTVKGQDGITYRHSKAWYTDWYYSTHLTCLTQYLNSTDTASTLIRYNSAGNILRVTLPSQMSYRYAYDPRYSMYVTSVTDTLGYTSSSGNFNYKYGIACRNVDMNGNVMLTQLDNLGRIVSCTRANEAAANVPYTIAFSYNTTVTKTVDNSISSPAYAVTRHYDPVHPDNPIETVAFADGMGRALQVKKDGYVDGTEKMIVSGRVKYDYFGRAIESYYPVVEDKTNMTKFNAAFDTYLTKTEYDVMDRVVQETEPDGTIAKTAYAIVNGLMRTTVTDALGNRKETFADGSGQTVQTNQYQSSDTVLTTTFAYDPVKQLSTVTDAMGKTTASIYDMAGRRTQVKHPASGITNFEYSPAGNLIARQTANLIPSGKKIRYYYTYNRLDSIAYPEHPENNVRYRYGDAADASGWNRKGRLSSQEDGSGTQEFKYGRQGELTEVKRTLVIPNQGVATYTTGWTYDSWSRLLGMTYPDGETVNYTYNTGGLLTGVGSSANSYVSDIKYDKFEQRTYLKYGNGTGTNYTYDPVRRRLQNLAVTSPSSGGGVGGAVMNNAYTYDAVSNVTKIVNTGTAANGIGGAITHNYVYDNLYRLKSANGAFTGAGSKTASYTLAMGYDKLYNITSKQQHIIQNDVQFAGSLQAGYDLSYAYNAGNCQQISNIAESNYRTEGTGANTPAAKVNLFSYDANGNLLSINTGTKQGDKLLATNSRKMLWDEENRLLAVSDNGYVSSYWYDALGERTVKESGDGEEVQVNGLLSGARTGTTNFTAYISPYLIVRNGGEYTKHIYMGGQRITSKVSNSGIFASSPVTTTELRAKYAAQTAKIKERFDSLGITYKGTPQNGGLVSSNPVATASSYFYHSDHLGSSSLITDVSGDIVQHVEYVPFGETFIDERRSASSWTTPYLFSGKERDEETGLLYFGARYQDSKYGIWYSVDPLAEKHPNISSYVYCADNPVKYVDPDGRDLVVLNAPKGAHNAGHMAILIQNPDGTWSLWSKNGTTKNGGLSGPNDKKADRGTGPFKSPEAFMKSQANKIDKETGKREYTEGYLIQSTKKEDRAAEKGATTELNKDYKVLESNCAQTVQSGLKAAGKNDGSQSLLSKIESFLAGGVVGETVVNKTPRLIYERIKKGNDGKVIK